MKSKKKRIEILEEKMDGVEIQLKCFSYNKINETYDSFRIKDVLEALLTHLNLEVVKTPPAISLQKKIPITKGET